MGIENELIEQITNDVKSNHPAITQEDFDDDSLTVYNEPLVVGEYCIRAMVSTAQSYDKDNDTVLADATFIIANLTELTSMLEEYDISEDISWNLNVGMLFLSVKTPLLSEIKNYRYNKKMAEKVTS